MNKESGHMVTMVALQALAYAQRPIAQGQEFEVDEGHVIALTYAKKAKKKEAAPEPEKRPSYFTRDMSATRPTLREEPIVQRETPPAPGAESDADKSGLS